MKIISLLFYVIAPVGIAFSYDFQKANQIEIGWVKPMGDEKYHYTVKKIASSNNEKNLYISGVYSDSLGLGNIAGVWLWGVDANGNKTLSLDVKNKDPKIRYKDIQAFLELKNDLFAFAVMGLTDKLFLAIVDKHGNEIKVTDSGMLSISTIIDDQNKGFYLIGAENEDPAIIRIDYAGKIVWRKRIKTPETDFFVDGVLANDNKLLLVKNSGIYGKEGLSDGQVSISVFDMDGNSVKEVKLSGRGGRVAINGANTLLLYDKNMGIGQNMQVAIFHEKLNKIKESSILEDPIGMNQFSLSSYKAGFIVVGQKQLKPVYISLDDKGVGKNQHTSTNSNPSVNVTGACGVQFCFSAATIMGFDKNKKPRKSIEITKFKYQP